MTAPPENTVKSRSLFMVGGYEPKSPHAFFQRTRRELGRSLETWQETQPEATAEVVSEELSSDGLLATATILSDRNVSTQFNFCVWNDIVLNDFSLPIVVRVGKYVRTFAEYVLTGTLFKMLGQAWRFSLYFLYPMIALAVVTLLASATGRLLVAVLPESAPSIAVGWAAGAATWWGLLKASGRRLFVLHLMDLWSFSRAYAGEGRPDARQHIDRWARAVADRDAAGEDDEIILVGHSTGGAVILDVAATALAMNSALGSGRARITVLTVGSTALKIGLHPSARWFRDKVQSLVSSSKIQWIECQSMTDAINFYKTDPVKAMGLEPNAGQQKPEVHLVRMKHMVKPAFYKRMRRNFFRVHYQFIMGNTLDYAYDFYAFCCSGQRIQETLGTTLRYLPSNDDQVAGMSHEHESLQLRDAA